MLYFFYGTDTGKARAHARAVIAVMKKKRLQAEYFRVTAEQWNEGAFEEFVSGQGLFEQKMIVFADGLFENADAKDWVVAHASDLGTSENAFVFLENKADAASLKKIEKVAQECKNFASASVENARGRFSNQGFNIFTLADALGQRDRVRLWSLLSEAFMEGITPEEINGVLFWQTKAMLSASLSGSATDAGLKPFVYEKSRRYASMYKPGELTALSRRFISMYHDAHRGLHDFATALERLALTL